MPKYDGHHGEKSSKKICYKPVEWFQEHVKSLREQSDKANKTRQESSLSWMISPQVFLSIIKGWLEFLLRGQPMGIENSFLIGVRNSIKGVAGLGEAPAGRSDEFTPRNSSR